MITRQQRPARLTETPSGMPLGILVAVAMATWPLGSASAQLRPKSVVPRATTPKSGISGLPALDPATNDLLQVAPYYQLMAQWRECAMFAVAYAEQIFPGTTDPAAAAIAVCSEKTQTLRSLIARELGVQQAEVVRIRLEYLIAGAMRLKRSRDHPNDAAAPSPRP